MIATSTPSPAAEPAQATPATPTTPATPVDASTASGTSNDPAFAQSLAKEMARIAAHATSKEQLKNGADLYVLAGGREVEEAQGRSPYVAKAGDWPPPNAWSTTAPAPGATTPTTPTTPAATPGPATPAAPAAPATPAATTTTTAVTPQPAVGAATATTKPDAGAPAA